MKLHVEPYQTQSSRWPASGRHILAQFDDESVVVYQAYRPGIGHFVAREGYFGGDFKLSRMSWIKPNFLWMMYRSAWATKEDQEVVLAIRLQRPAFDSILAKAVPSTFQADLFPDHAAWQHAVADSNVRVQFDPDHGPSGSPVERRAIQLGLRGETLSRYAREWIVDIEDISFFVREQHQHVLAGRLDLLTTPTEDVFPVADSDVRRRLGLS